MSQQDTQIEAEVSEEKKQPVALNEEEQKDGKQNRQRDNRANRQNRNNNQGQQQRYQPKGSQQTQQKYVVKKKNLEGEQDEKAEDNKNADQTQDNQEDQEAANKGSQRQKSQKRQQKLVYRVKGQDNNQGEDEQEESKEQERPQKKYQEKSKTRPQPQYRVKDPNRKPEEEAENEEEGDQENGNQNPEHQKKKYQRKGEGQQDDRNDTEGNNHNRKRRDNRRDPQKEQRPYTAYEEYMYGDWRKPRPRIFVTIETEIPEMPKDIIETPDEPAYHKGQLEIDEKIDALNEKIRDFAEKFSDKLGQMKADQSGKGVISKEFRDLIEQFKTKSAEKKRIYDEVNAINAEIGDLEAKKTKAEKKLHPKYNRLDTLAKGIAEIEKTLQTTTNDAKKEKEYIREMQIIKDSKPFIEEINGLRDLIYEKKSLKYKTGSGLNELKEECKFLKASMDKLKKTQDDKQNFKEDIQKQLDSINANRTKLIGEIKELRAVKEQRREEYYKKLIEYEKQQIIIKEIEWIAMIKARVEDREEQKRQWEEEKVKRQEERKQRIEDQIRREENRKKREEEYLKQEEDKQKKWEEHMLSKLDIHPYISEIDLCDYLIKYCEKNMKRPGEDMTIRQLSELEKSLHTDELRKKTIQDALQKGKLMKAETKEERQQKDMVAVQNKKKSQVINQARAPVKQEEDDQLNLDLLMIQKFSQIKVSAPMKKEDLEHTLSELKEMKQAFIEKGDQERAENKKKFVRDQKRGRNDKQAEEEEKTKEGEELPELSKSLAEKMKIVEQIGLMKKKKFSQNQYDDEGIDVDTFEANYVPEYEDEDADRRRDSYQGRGGRGQRGGPRGGRGQRGGRGGYRDGQGSRGGYRNDRNDRNDRGGYRGRDERREQNYEEQEGEGEWENQYGEKVESKVAKVVGKKFQEVLTKQEEWPEI